MEGLPWDGRCKSGGDCLASGCVVMLRLGGEQLAYAHQLAEVDVVGPLLWSKFETSWKQCVAESIRRVSNAHKQAWPVVCQLAGGDSAVCATQAAASMIDGHGVQS